MSATNRERDGRRPRGAVASFSTAPEVTHLVVGRVLGPRGVRGELRATIESDDPERIRHLSMVYVGEERRPFQVRGARLHKGQALLRLEGIDTREASAALRGAYLYVALADALPLGEDEYYHYQIEGLAVRTEAGEALGRVRAVLETGANDVYLVRGPRGEILLPAIKEVILRVDLSASTITVRLPPGLEPQASRP